jgi:hypothetical protein
MNPIIELSPWEYEAGFSVGIARYVRNWDRADAAHYAGNRQAMEPDRKANPAATLCEIAVARHLNQYWHGHVWSVGDHGLHRNAADVGENIEVRRTRGDTVAVRRTDAGKIVWAARTLDDEYRKIEILGWVAADDVIQRIPTTAGSYLRYPVGELRSPWDRACHPAEAF